jgi:hypothetical protein
MYFLWLLLSCKITFLAQLFFWILNMKNLKFSLFLITMLVLMNDFSMKAQADNTKILDQLKSINALLQIIQILAGVLSILI